MRRLVHIPLLAAAFAFLVMALLTPDQYLASGYTLMSLVTVLIHLGYQLSTKLDAVGQLQALTALRGAGEEGGEK